jgi:hypothetical protein
MKKRLSVALFVLAAAVATDRDVAATPVTFNFVGDNLIHNWYMVDGGGTTTTLPHLGTSFASMDVDTITLDLAAGTYQFIWQVTNYADAAAWPINPGGFLAEVTSPDATGSYLTSSQWSVASQADSYAVPLDFNSLSWVAATSWARNGDPSIWLDVYHGPVPGISLDAEWIWTAANFDDPAAPDENDSVFVRGIVTVADDCSEFPGGGATGGCFPGSGHDGQFVPDGGATLLLFGLGLVGLAAGRRRWR